MARQQSSSSRGVIRTAWLAALGAASRTAQMGTRTFERLISQGKEEAESRKEAGKERMRDVRNQVADAIDKTSVAVESTALGLASPVQPVAVRELPKVSKTMAEKLRKQGIEDSAQLLAATSTPADRREMARTLAVTEDTVLRLAHRADFARIEGVGKVYAELLERSGIATIKELATRRPDSVLEDLEQRNDELGVAERLPTESELASWINQAKRLPRGLHY